MDNMIIAAVVKIETLLYLITFEAKLWKNEESLLIFFFSAFFIFGRPNIIIPAGIITKDNIIATSTPKAVKIPKYLIG